MKILTVSHRPSELMPETDEVHQIFYKLNNMVFWTAAEPPTMYHPFAWLDLTSTNQDGANIEISIDDVEWWAELPEILGR